MMEERQEPGYHVQDNVRVPSSPVAFLYARSWNDLMLMLLLAVPCMDSSSKFVKLKIQHVQNHHIVCF